MDEKIDSISFQQLVEDLVESDSLSGTAKGHVRLTGRGKNSSEVLGNLQGDLGLALTEGALEGINIWYEIRRGMALYKGLPAPDPEPKRTVFSRLDINGTAKDGVVTTQELTGELPFLAIRGSGKIDLGQSQLNLGLVAEVRNSPELADDPLASGLGGKSLPFKITGPLDAPSLSVDWEALLKSEAADILLNKLGLGPKEEPASDADAVEGGESAESTDSEPEEESSKDQLKETAKGALFKLLKGKDKGEDTEKEENGN
jgi:AsmA protein